MKASYPLVGFALLVGVGIGAAGIGALDAQSRASPGYFVAESVVIDQDTFQKFLTQVPATIAAFKGRYVVRGGTVEIVTGEPPARLAIIAFPSAAEDVSPSGRRSAWPGH